MNNSKVSEQFKRVSRWYDRFSEIDRGRAHSRESEYYEDVVFSFFQNIWALRDWIINSAVLEKEVVDAFFHNDLDLKFCRDIANGSKHLKIKDPSIDQNLKISRRVYSLTLGIAEPEIQVRFYIEASGYKSIDAYELSGVAKAKCEAFLRQNNLI